MADLYARSPAAQLATFARVDAEESLKGYIKLCWPVLEPGREFVDGWVVDAICEHLEAVSANEIKRLLINVPPGCMKSLTTNVFWPSWEWGPRARPNLRYVSASYSEKLTVRDNRRTKNLIESELYQANWGDRFKLSRDSHGKVRFDNDATGFKIATSVGGLGTGERGDRFIIDDPHNVKQAESQAVRDSTLQWFTEVVPSRIVDPSSSAIVVIMQRVHSSDVSGLIISKLLGYEHLCLPMEFERKNRCFTTVPRVGIDPERVRRVKAEDDPVPYYLPDDDGPLLTCQDRRVEEGDLLWPERFTSHHLETELKPQLRAWGGTYAEAGQLQQRPVPRGGGMFQRDDFQYLDAAPPGATWVRGWDLAGSKDGHAAWTAAVKMSLHEGSVIIADVIRFRGTPGEVEKALKTTAHGDGRGTIVDLPQDPGQAGLAQKRTLVGLLQGYEVYASPESGSKEDRARPLAAQAEAANVYLVRGSWNDSFVAEACLFPNGDFTDQVDAASRAHARCVILSMRGQRPPTGGELIE